MKWLSRRQAGEDCGEETEGALAVTDRAEGGGRRAAGGGATKGWSVRLMIRGG